MTITSKLNCKTLQLSTLSIKSFQFSVLFRFFKLLQKTVLQNLKLFMIYVSLNDFLLMTVFQTILFWTTPSNNVRLPEVLDRLIEFIREKGKGCLIFKTDLRRAFRQIPVDPIDIPLLGFQVNDLLYFHVVLPFGLHSAVLICQCTAKAVIFILTKDNNVLVDAYIDDFFGAATVEEAPFVYNKLLFLLQELGLEISPEKCFQLSASMICLGILFDTELMKIYCFRRESCKIKGRTLYLVVDFIF